MNLTEHKVVGRASPLVWDLRILAPLAGEVAKPQPEERAEGCFEKATTTTASSPSQSAKSLRPSQEEKKGSATVRVRYATGERSCVRLTLHCSNCRTGRKQCSIVCSGWTSGWIGTEGTGTVACLLTRSLWGAYSTSETKL